LSQCSTAESKVPGLPSLSEDLLDGVSAIAAYLGLQERRTYYLLESKQLPAFKIGGKWAARKSSLIRQIDAYERARWHEMTSLEPHPKDQDFAHPRESSPRRSDQPRTE
jgi:hypothetical protein